MKKLSIFLVLFLGISLVFTFAIDKINVNNSKDKPVYVQDELVIKFDKTANKKELKDKYGLKLKRNSKKGIFAVYSHATPDNVIQLLKKEKGVVYAERNPITYALSVPNDPYYQYQWHLTRIGMESAWDISTGSGVVVAVLDSGVRESLEDFANTNFVAGYNFIRNNTNTDDDNQHGSHVAGTVAQSTNNGVGVAGVAYNATIMPVKVLDRRGNGNMAIAADAIVWAVDNGADIINMSLGGTGTLTALGDAIDYAYDNDVLIVCAAGNDATDAAHYPSFYPKTISVSATSSLDTLASYSNYGSTIDISAPGGDTGDNNGDGYDDMVLQNTFVRKDEGYYFFPGTSMAAPHVAGVAALIKAYKPSLTAVQIRTILETSSEDLGPAGWDQSFGHGLVDAHAAVLMAQTY